MELVKQRQQQQEEEEQKKEEEKVEGPVENCHFLKVIFLHIFLFTMNLLYIKEALVVFKIK